MQSFNCEGRIGKEGVTLTTGMTADGKTWSRGNFSIAVESYRGGKEVVSWFDCVIWGVRAETLAKYAAKGRQLILKGEIIQEKYTVRETGEVKRVHRLHVDDFSFGSTPKTHPEAEGEFEMDVPTSTPELSADELADIPV